MFETKTTAQSTSDLSTKHQNSGVQRSGDARGDCFIVCPLPNFSIEQSRVVVIVTE